MELNLVAADDVFSSTSNSQEREGLSGLPLEEELLHLLGTGRDARIAAAYYGLDGLGGRSLRVVGGEYGLTYERVRQIATSALKQIGSSHPPAPTLDRAVELVSTSIPASANEIEAKLLLLGLSAGPFRLDGVLNAAKLFGRTASFSITEVKGSRLVHGRLALLRDSGFFNSVMRVALRAASRWGVANLHGVMAQLHKTRSPRCSKDLVRGILTCHGGFRWLDQSTGWFWFPIVSRNPAVNRIMKILSVTNPVRAVDLRAGISRDHRMREISTPLHVLMELCRQLPTLHVYDRKVRAKSPVDPKDVLDEAEKRMARALSESGGRMARSKLEPICRQMGVKRPTFYHHLSYSPIIVNNATGVYGLIGSRIA